MASRRIMSGSRLAGRHSLRRPGLDDDRLLGTEADIEWLAEQYRLLAPGAAQKEAAGGPRPAAEQTPRLMPHPLHEAGKARFMANRPDHAPEARTAAMSAWAGGIHDQLVGIDQQGYSCSIASIGNSRCW